MSLFDRLNFAEKAREKKKRGEYLESLSPEQRASIFDAALAERRMELSAERAGITAGLGRAVDFSKTGVMSSFAAVALTPSMGFEGAAVAAGGIAATSMTSAAALAAQDAWVNYQSKKLDVACSAVNRKLFVSDGVVFDPSDSTFKAPLRALGIDKMSVADMQAVLQSKALGVEQDKPVALAVERAQQKQALARAVAQQMTAPAVEPFEGVISAGKVPEKTAEKAVDAVEQEQQKQALAREAVPQMADTEKVSPQPVVPNVKVSPAEDSAKEVKETDHASRHIVGDNRDFKQFALSAMASGTTLVDNNGKPVIETKDALIAPASPLMTDAKRQERVEAMVDHATQKFPGQPLRLDGNAKFVEMAIEAALARGLTVEVPARHAQLLAEKEQALAQRKAQNLPDVEGVISAGKIPEKSVARVEDTPPRTTGKLVGFSADVGEDGRRQVTIQRAGQDVAVWLPAAQANPDDLKPLVGKPVRYEPPTANQPARLVDRTPKKKQSLEAGLEVQR